MVITDKFNQINFHRMWNFNCTLPQCVIAMLHQHPPSVTYNFAMNYAVQACNNPATLKCKCSHYSSDISAMHIDFSFARASSTNCWVLKIYFLQNGIETESEANVFSCSKKRKLYANNSRRIENTNHNDTDITWLAVPYCVKKSGSLTHTHTNANMQNICAISNFCMTHKTHKM